MLTAIFVALALIVSAILITRHHYLNRIEALVIVQQNKINLDFRRGHDAGWEGAMRYRDNKASLDKALDPKNK